jgi:glucan phosphorylase
MAAGIRRERRIFPDAPEGSLGKIRVLSRCQGTWYAREPGAHNDLLVAYFSAESGITECLSIFAGGLGVLAGDHLKASSDLGLPLVDVGLLYQEGYFRQYLNVAGWQQEAFEENDSHTLPVELIPNVNVRINCATEKLSRLTASDKYGTVAE